MGASRRAGVLQRRPLPSGPTTSSVAAERVSPPNPPAFRNFPFFSRLSVGTQREVSSFPMQRVDGRVALLTRGDDANGAYFVTKGAMRVFYITPEGREATLYRIEPGQTCLLALTSSFNDEPYPAWVESGPRGVSFVRVPSVTFRRMYDEEPAFRQFLFQVLSGRVLELMQSLEAVGTERVAQRLARLLLQAERPDHVVRSSQARLAQELGTAREVVFRNLRALAQLGLVRTSREKVTILDVAGLRALASR